MSIVVRLMAPLSFSRGYVKNKIALICAKFGANLINNYKVTSRETKVALLFWPTLYVSVVILHCIVMHHRDSMMNSNNDLTKPIMPWH